LEDFSQILSLLKQKSSLYRSEIAPKLIISAIFLVGPKIFKAIQAGLTNQHDIPDFFTDTPLCTTCRDEYLFAKYLWNIPILEKHII